MFWYLQVCALLSATVVGGFVPSLKAGQWDKRTSITLNQRVAVKNVVLPPGEYVLKVLDSSWNPEVVEIFIASIESSPMSDAIFGIVLRR
jgi:hypothetical protein